MTNEPSAETPSTDIEARSEIARFLGKEVWPADRDRLLEVAADNDATDDVLRQLSSLPSGRAFGNVQEVSEELSLAAPQHEGPGAD
jgi:hypothetical protein